MALLGAHVSVAGGLPLSVARASALGCDAFQIFARNPNRWEAPPLEDQVVRGFRRALDRSGLTFVVSHGSYLVNLAAADAALRARSLDAMQDELTRAEALGLAGVVLHPGSSGSETPLVAVERIATALRHLLRMTPQSPTLVLLEHTAGQGRSVGHTFEHLASLIAGVDGSARVAVCLDTCHLLASGYDISTPAGYRRTFVEFDRLVGLDRLRLFHVNDSKKPCGSRVDRHAHIGDGHVGLPAFGRLVNDRRFRDVPMLLETEKQPVRRPCDTLPDPFDVMNLDRLRRLVKVP